MNVYVLGGGVSTEREVSLRSAKAVSNNLIKAGFTVVDIDLQDFSELDIIEKDSIVLPILHGKIGEDGEIQKELEKRNIAYLGSNSVSSKNCFNKNVSREIFIKNNIPVAKGGLVDSESYRSHELFKMPHVLKINEGGSSIGTYIVKDPIKISQFRVDEVFQLGEYAVIEEFVPGIEITVPILDGKALPVIEIQPPVDGEFDYKNKYNGNTK